MEWLNLSFITSKKIIDTLPNDFLSFTVYGHRRIGKTIFSLLVATEVYNTIEDCGIEKAYKMALGSLVFSIEDVVDIVDKHSIQNKKPVVIWDDVGIHASGLMYHAKQTEFADLKAQMDIIGDSVNCLILTTPSFKGLVSFLKTYDEMRVKIIRVDSKYRRRAQFYSTTTLPSGTMNLRKEWSDEYSIKLNDSWYLPYVKKREAAKKELTDYLKIRIQEKKDYRAQQLKKMVANNYERSY
jgi:hypothetical protein